MRKRFRKITAALLIIVMIVLMIPFSVICASAITQSEFDNRLNNLRNQYPNYSTWYDSFDGGTQCFGFARLVAYNVFGSHVRDWEVSYSIDGVKAGDVLQYGNTSGSGHTVFVTSVSGDTITFVDCNGNGNYSGGTKVRTCGIKWDNTINKWGNMYGRIGFSYRHVSPAIEPDEPVIHHWYDDCSPSDIGTGFFAYIEHQGSGLFLTNTERNVYGTNPDGSRKQIWRFDRQSNGAYTIQSIEDWYYMDVYGPYDADNTNVHTWPEYTGGSNQQFFIYDCYGAYYFRPAHSDERVLDMASTDDHNVSIWYHGDDWAPQEFNIVKIDMYGNLPINMGSEFYAEIEHQKSGLLLTNSERNVFGAEAEGSNKQIWKFNRQQNGAYTIQSVEDGCFMDVYGPYDEDDTNVHTWPEYVGGKNQQFFVYYMYDAYYFRPAHSQTRMLDLSSDSDRNLELWIGGQNWEPQEFNILKTDMYGNLPVNMGSEFCAEIEHQSSGLLLTNSNRNVYGEKKLCSEKQAWKFTRTPIGAYKIQNVDDGSYLDVYGVYDEDDTNVYTWPEYTGGLNQQFFIYNMYGASYLRPLHTSTRMLDMSSTDDHNLSLWIGGQDWAPQEFNINIINQNDIGKHNYIKEILSTEKGIVVKFTCKECGDSYFEHEYMIADTNLDGRMNVNDVTAIQRHLVELEKFNEEQLALADTNGDGKIDISDATHLQMYLAEYDVVLGKQ